MSKTQAALQRRLGRLSMLVDLTARFVPGSPHVRDLRNELGILKDPTQDPAALQRAIGRASVLVEQLRKELPNQKELLEAMLKELSWSTEIVSRIDIPVQQHEMEDAGGRR